MRNPFPSISMKGFAAEVGGNIESFAEAVNGKSATRSPKQGKENRFILSPQAPKLGVDEPMPPAHTALFSKCSRARDGKRHRSCSVRSHLKFLDRCGT